MIIGRHHVGRRGIGARAARFWPILPALAAIAFAPATSRGDFLYGVTDNAVPGNPNNGVLVKIDPASGAASLVGNTGFSGLEDIVSIGGKLLATGSTGRGLAGFTNHAGLIQIDPTTGRGTLIGPAVSATTAFLFVEGLAVAGGTLYGSASRVDIATQTILSAGADLSDALITIDPTTGRATQVGLFGPNFVNIEDIAFSPKYGLIGADLGELDPATNYQTFVAGRTPSLIRIDPNAADKTHLATKIADLPPSMIDLVSNPLNNLLSPFGPFVAGLDFAPDGTLYGSTLPTHFGGVSELLKIDPTTGAITTVGTIATNDLPSLYNVDGIAYVPEPTSLVLLGLGGLGLTIAGRRRASRRAGDRRSRI